MEKIDTIIVGAGPAGLKCAEILSSAGKSVLVLEKNKTLGDKVCAGGLTHKALHLGIPRSIIQRHFKRILFHTPHQDAEISMPEPFLATIDRKALGRWMAACAKRAGAEIRMQSSVTRFSQKSVTIADGTRIAYTHLVGADGAYSIVRQSLGLCTKNLLEAFHYVTPKRFKDMECYINTDKFGPEYLWIFPHKNSTSVGTGGDLTQRAYRPNLNLPIKETRKNFDAWCADRFDISKARFEAALINYDYQGHSFGSTFLAGDAAGLASGLTGEGIYAAIESGEDIANLILDKRYPCDNITHILKVKKYEEELLRSFEINKQFTKLEAESLLLLLKLRWFGKLAAEIIGNN